MKLIYRFKNLLNIVILMTFVFVMVVSCRSFFNGNNEQEDKDKAELGEHEENRIKKIEELKVKYNAVVFEMKDILFAQELYTVELERLLIREDNRPILFSSLIQDVQKRDEEYFVHFRPFYGLLGINLFLKCDAQFVNQILSKKPHIVDEVLVVASIDSIKRPMFEISTEMLSEDEPAIYIEESNEYIALGRCIDIMLLLDNKGK